MIKIRNSPHKGDYNNLFEVELTNQYSLMLTATVSRMELTHLYHMIGKLIGVSTDEQTDRTGIVQAPVDRSCDEEPGVGG